MKKVELRITTPVAIHYKNNLREFFGDQADALLEALVRKKKGSVKLNNSTWEYRVEPNWLQEKLIKLLIWLAEGPARKLV